MKLQIVLQMPKNEDKSSEYTYILPDEIMQVEDGSFTNIELSNVLDFIPQRLDYLELCVRKLRDHGTISMCGLDILEISKSIIIGKYTADEINHMIYQGKQSLDCLQRLLVWMHNMDMKILEKRLVETTYYLKASKE